MLLPLHGHRAAFSSSLNFAFGRPLPTLYPSPVTPLRRDIRSRNDAPMGIYKEHGEYFPVPGFGTISYGERRDAVLEGVGKGDQAAFFRFNTSELLRYWLSMAGATGLHASWKPVYFMNKMVPVLLV